MMLVVLGIVLQLATLAIQGIQCWLDAHRHGLCPGCSGCPGCSSPRAALPASGRGHQGQHRRR
jgi:hypothetical protein